MSTIRTLVLSGGGGRGAFHAGVYQYLCESNKPGIDHDHQGAWIPDIVVGTSIGAVNGAAIVQGISSEELVRFWRSLREQDVQGLPPGMTRLGRWFANQVLQRLIGVSLPAVSPGEATSTEPEPGWKPLPGMGRLGMRLLGRWSSFLDTGPLQKTITTRLGLDEERIAASPRTLLINATDVRTGQRVTFSNRPVFRRGSHNRREDVLPGVSIRRILASCSIPLVYPWTVDPETQSAYWDGAVVTNTPLGVALDAAGAFPSQDVMEVIVVLMTPWRDTFSGSPALPALPQDFSEAATWALDWALLASFRERLDLIDAYNRLRSFGLRTGDPELSAIRQMNVVIVSPQDFFSAARILDYDARSEALIRQGYEAAARAFHGHFSILSPDDLARMQAEVELAG